MKKIFFLSFTFFLLFHISALGFGINNSVNIIKLEENEYLPDYLIAPETSFFISEDYFINSLFLSSKPSLCISDEKISFRFYEIKLSAVFNNLAISAGKFNNYWGKAIIKNDYFPDVKNITPTRDNFWNCNLNFIINNFTFNGGSIFDTNSIDEFTLPKWNSYYLQSEFSHPYISAGIMSNLYQKEDKSLDFKSTGELLITYFSDVTFYGDGTIRLFNITSNDFNKDFSFTAGVTFQSLMNYINFYSQFELGIDKSDFFSGLLISVEYNSRFQLSTQLTFKDNQIILIPKIGYEFNNFNFHIEAMTNNILNELTMSVISIGVSYEI